MIASILEVRGRKTFTGTHAHSLDEHPATDGLRLFIESACRWFKILAAICRLCAVFVLYPKLRQTQSIMAKFNAYEVFWLIACHPDSASTFCNRNNSYRRGIILLLELPIIIIIVFIEFLSNPSRVSSNGIIANFLTLSPVFLLILVKPVVEFIWTLFIFSSSNPIANLLKTQARRQRGGAALKAGGNE